MNYNITAISNLIIKIYLENHSGLVRDCSDHPQLKLVLAHFKPASSLIDNTNVLIQYCNEKNCFRDLLVLLKTKYSGHYSEFESKLMYPSELTPDEIKKIKGILEKKLAYLNWKPQRDTFIEVLKQFDYGARAFLVHGAPSCGQNVLSHHLIQQAQGGERGWEAREITIYITENLECLSLDIYFDLLWQEVNYVISGTRSPDSMGIEDILKRLTQLLETHDVFITIKDIANLEPTGWTMLLENFWHPIVRWTEPTVTKKGSRLFLMLVDLKGKCQDWQDCLEPSKNSGVPQYPIRLPKSSYFSQDDITRWLNNHPDIKKHLETEMLYNKSTMKGHPHLVYRTLCNKFKIDPKEVFPQGVY